MSKLCLGCMEQYGEEFNVCPNCGYIEGTKQEEAVHMEPGSMLYGRYIIGRVLGFGGFGVTYIGWDTKLEQKVAIKEYLPSEFSTRMPGEATVTVFGGERNEQFLDGLDKFVEEAKRLANFQNEAGIVKVFDSFKENNTAYIIMEYLDGETLTSYMEREGTIREDKAIEMLTPVMMSLQSVHEKGILHRDIAPDNIFILKNGEVKLIDFGASRYATTSHSRSLTVIIKPGYSPEEQYRSRGDQGPHTDVYALAAVMYKMITGTTPPDALERRALIETKRKDLLKDIHKTEKNISVNTENAILNAMNVQIEDRTPDVISFMGELNSTEPVKRRYGKIKKIDVYSWPMWLKVTLPICILALITTGILLMAGVIKFPSLFSDEIVIPEGTAVVPEVEGMNKDEALKLIEDNNLLPVPSGNVESEYVEVGKIVLQNPNPGSYLPINSNVILTVSSGKGVVEVENGMSTIPYVIWDTEANAISKLQQAGLDTPIIETAEDDNVAAGMVISQSIEAGTKVQEGTKITIVVSTGPAAFNMPNVVGMASKQAKSTLEAKGLIVSVTYAKNDSVKEDNVISQSVDANSQVKKGDSITITVSSGKPLFSVDNVIGMTRSKAVSTLENKGFKVIVMENWSSTVASGTVISQNPVAGVNLIKGSEVTIYVSKGKQPITVTFDGNGGSVSPKTATKYVTDAYGTLPTPTKTGHTFLGWYTSASGGEKITADTTISRSVNHTLYAQWKANQYTVYFNGNGGSVSQTSKTVMYGNEYGTLPTPKRDYYTFTGWYDSSGNKVTSSTIMKVTGDHTLTARWSVNSYVASWNSGTGYSITVKRTLSPTNQGSIGNISSGAKIYEGDVLAITYTASTGYSINSKGSTSITVKSNITASNIYASATLKDYTYNIVYKSINGTNLGSSTATYKYGTTNTISAPAKSGYITPSSQNVKWDSTSVKTITFTYSPTTVASSKTVANINWGWCSNCSPHHYYMFGVGIAEYTNRTASSVQIRIKWTNTIQAGHYYDYVQYITATVGGVNIGQVKISNGFPSGQYSERSSTGYSDWITINLNTTNKTTVSLSGNCYRSSRVDINEPWSGTITIPAY